MTPAELGTGAQGFPWAACFGTLNWAVGQLYVRRDDLVGDVRRAANVDWDFYVGRSDGPVDRADWSMTPQTVDPYNGILCDIVFAAAILQPPIFDPNADDAVNYGAVGAVTGHELIHGFDDQGRTINAAGALRDWWTPADDFLEPHMPSSSRYRECILIPR